MKKTTASLMLLVVGCNVAYAADDSVSQQIQLLNSQIQTQLQTIQSDQQKQIQTLNKQIQAQLKQIQTDLQAQIQKGNAQTQAQIKELQTNLQVLSKAVPPK